MLLRRITSDPEVFFLPIDRFNERVQERNAHPDWSFYGKDFPSNRELQEAPARLPPQGRWRIYGLGLPDAVLRKVYQQNAARPPGITA